MSRSRRGFRPRLSRWCLLAGIAFALLPSSAAAGPLDGVEETVKNAATQAAATVEAAVPPAAVPSSAGQNPAQLPEVPVPAVPVKVPSVTVPQAKVKAPSTPPVEAPARGLPDPSGGDLSAPAVADVAASAVESVVGATTGVGSTGTVLDRQTANTAIDSVEDALGRSAAADPESGNREAGGREAVDAGPTGPSAGQPAPVTSTRPALLAAVPASLLDHFIHVWPAVALIAERSLDGYVGNWSRSLLARFEEQDTRSLGGAEGTLADPTTGSHSSVGQPAFSRLAQRASEPFEWVGSEKALLVLALFLVLATASLTILTLARREVGLPLLRRGNRFPWRH
jgi:hypothetical protein